MPKLFRPYISWRSIFYVVRVLLGTEIAEGKWVKTFEYEFGKKFNKRNVVALNSGTSALELAYELAGIQVGDEVITPVLTCTATNIPLVRIGAKIVFADIDYDLNINIEDVKRKITRHTKAIVFVHFGGNNRGLTELVKICKERKITLIEDAAQAVGSDTWGLADFTCVSLQAIKTLTAGDGGIILCKSKKDYEKARRLRWFGYDREKKQKLGDTDLKEAGYKYHMNNVAGAIALGNLRSFDSMMKKRNKLREFYNNWNMTEDAYDDDSSISCHNWLCIQWGAKGNQHHYRNDKYTIFKKFKNDCPIMDEIENDWRLLPYHHKVTIKQAKKAIYE